MSTFCFRLIRKILSLIIFFGWASGVFAMDHHHYDGHQKAASPFAQKNKPVRLHCLLQGHNYYKPCPKHLKANQKSHLHYQLASECGGSSTPVKFFSLNFKTSFLENTVFIFSNTSFGNDFAESRNLFNSIIFFSEIPPPRLIV